MAQEIERKFLAISLDFKQQASRKVEICQGYLSRDPERVVRVRLAGDKGRLTVKGLTRGCCRLEYEYAIPAEDAAEMLKLCTGRIVRKTRWIVHARDGNVWEVDEFHDDLAPLVVAEIELNDSVQEFEKPGFIGREVTGDPAYYNSAL